MIRDKIKDKEYYSKYLAKKEKLFKIMTLAMEQRKMAKDFEGQNDKGILNAYKGLSVNYMLYLIAQYSAGESIELVKESYQKALLYSEKIWKENLSYVDCIWLITLGIMLGISGDELIMLKSIVKKYNKHDKLIEFFMSYLGEEKGDSSTYFMPMPYKLWDEYIECKKKDITPIKRYLKDTWYNAHNTMAWYDTHNDSSNTYCGYWSFETGAIVKVLGLDDSELKDLPYYPYDLVHYMQ